MQRSLIIIGILLGLSSAGALSGETSVVRGRVLERRSREPFDGIEAEVVTFSHDR
jgi:hypothetical protein